MCGGWTLNVVDCPAIQRDTGVELMSDASHRTPSESRGMRFTSPWGRILQEVYVPVGEDAIGALLV